MEKNGKLANTVFQSKVEIGFCKRKNTIINSSRVKFKRVAVGSLVKASFLLSWLSTWRTKGLANTGFYPVTSEL